MIMIDIVLVRIIRLCIRLVYRGKWSDMYRGLVNDYLDAILAGFFEVDREQRVGYASVPIFADGNRPKHNTVFTTGGAYVAGSIFRLSESDETNNFFVGLPMPGRT